MKRLVAAVALVLIIFGATTIASAAVPEPRVALVIGNSSYDTSPLKNPVNDARLVAETLRDLGFQVIEQANANQKGMRRLLRDFGDALQDAGPDSVGLFYFSGHGVQVRGENFLIPTDAVIGRESDVKIEAVSANEVLNTLSFADNRLNIVILDACRNNPYAGLFKSPGRGLVRMNAPQGTLVAYSTAPGTLARDGEGANSPYTTALASAMRASGVAAEQMFKRVRVAVMEETNGEQVPWEESSLTGDFYFNATETATEREPSAPSTTVLRADPSAMELALWQSIQDSSDPVMFEAYLRRFPEGTFSEVAGLKRDALREAVEPGVPATPPTTTKTTRVDFDVAFWNAVKDSKNATNFEAYLEKFPEGHFALLARARLAAIERTAAEEAEQKRKTAEEAYRREAERKAAEEAARKEAERKAAEEAAHKETARLAAEAEAKRLAEEEAAHAAAEAEAERKAAAEADAKRRAAEEAKRKATEAQAAAAQRQAQERALWDTIKDSNRAVDYRVYLQLFPNGTYAVLARARLAEAERLATEEAKRKEAERKAAEAAKAQRATQQEVQTALLSPPTKTSVLITEEEILKNQRIRDLIINYYDKHKVRQKPSNRAYLWITVMESILDIKVREISNGTAKIEVEYKWYFPDISTRHGSARGIVTIEKSGSSYKVLKFETGGYAY